MRNMRVSNLHHETAVQVLYYLQEVEADTWNRLTARLAGINTAGHLRADMFAPKDLPFMFASWREYRDYLLEHLVDDPKIKAIFRRQFASNERMYRNPKVLDDLCRLQISAVLVNDHFGTKLASFHASHGMYSINAGSKGGRTHAGLELVNK
jgi:predicted phosphoadenosine phosphosulfate sulfurtransferase